MSLAGRWSRVPCVTDLLAVANADAGTATDDATAQAVEVLERSYAVTVVTTGTPDELHAALGEHPETRHLVVLGGDGSLHAVVQALHETDRLSTTVLGLVPLGTGNDYARSIGLPDDPCKAAEIIVAGRTIDADLALQDGERIVVNASHVGIGAEAAHAARPWKKVLGPLGYAVGALISAISVGPAWVEVYLDGEPLPAKHRVLQLAVGTGQYVGGGTELLPEADPTDGLLDVAVSYAVGLRRRFRYAVYLRRGEHPKLEDVIYRRATTVRVVGEELRCTCDGELIGPAPAYEWRVLPSALRLFVP